MRNTTPDSMALHQGVGFILRLSNLLKLGFLVYAAGVFLGCRPIAPSLPVSGTTSSGSSGSSGTPGQITEPSVYVEDDTSNPIIRVFPKSTTTATSETVNIPGTNVSVDDGGNIYVFDYSSGNIVEYPAGSPSDPPVRTIPVGLGKKILAVHYFVASATGKIFVFDGQGIAVFLPGTGNADVDPDRYIRGVTQSAGGISTPIKPGIMAVDRSDNLYVQNKVDGSIAVFGPKDTGTVAPMRTIAGPLTNLTNNGSTDDNGQEYHFNFSMTTDSSGNLYALCFFTKTNGTGNAYGVLEFDAAADGNAAPVRFITAPEMYPWTGGNSLAIDSAGTIYVSAGTTGGTPAVFEFSADASGSVEPSNTVFVQGWLDAEGPSSIAVH